MGVINVLKSSVPLKSKSASTLASLPYDIPQGCLAVYVGEERRRFVIRAEYLKHEIFQGLLKRSEEEFGFCHQGGLQIVCDPATFEHLLSLMRSKRPSVQCAQMAGSPAVSQSHQMRSLQV